MLLVFDTTGKIEQQIFIGEMDKLKEIYESHGKLALVTLEDHTIADSYVTNPTDELHRAICVRPDIAVEAPMSSVAANGEDELAITVSPMKFSYSVMFQGATVAMGGVEDGVLSFVTDHAGTYEIGFTADFPYKPTSLTVEAT